MAKRRNDSAWRNACAELYGTGCLNCGDTRTECNHIWPRSQGGPSVVENGSFLCGPFSLASPFPGGCHEAYTRKRLKMRREWLTSEQERWLKSTGYVWWDSHGIVWGRGYRNFAPAVELERATEGTGG